MTLTLMLKLYKLWTAINNIKTGALKGMGWKGITGSIIFGLGVLLECATYFFPTYAAGLSAAGKGLIALGGTLGGIGIRLAIAKK